jgi:predicted transcriptional regulator
MGIFGLFSLNFFLLLVAIFIYSAVNSETRTEQLEELLQGARVRDLMNPDVHTVPPDIHVSDLMQKMFQDHHRGYPVTDPAGHVLGLVTLRDIQGKDPAAAVRDVMQPNAPMLSEDATAVEALRLMSRNGMGRVIATHNGGEMSGIITKTDLMRAIMLRSNARGLGHQIHFDSSNPI